MGRIVVADIGIEAESRLEPDRPAGAPPPGPGRPQIYPRPCRRPRRRDAGRGRARRRCALRGPAPAMSGWSEQIGIGVPERDRPEAGRGRSTRARRPTDAAIRRSAPVSGATRKPLTSSAGCCRRPPAGARRRRAATCSPSRTGSASPERTDRSSPRMTASSPSCSADCAGSKVEQAARRGCAERAR